MMAAALQTQVATAHQIVQAGGHYVLTVKKNPPALYDALTLFFAPPTAPLQDARTVDYAHGRRFRARVALCWPFGASVALVSCSGRPSQTPRSVVAALQAPLLGYQMPFRVRHALLSRDTAAEDRRLPMMRPPL